MTPGSCFTFTGVGNESLAIPAEIFVLKVSSWPGCRADPHIAISDSGLINTFMFLPPPYINLSLLVTTLLNAVVYKSSSHHLAAAPPQATTHYLFLQVPTTMLLVGHCETTIHRRRDLDSI